MNKLERLVKKQKEGVAEGICSVCSSNTFVIDAALLQAKESKTDVLIEATANQVNQMGGYTGMHRMVLTARLRKAQRLGFPNAAARAAALAALPASRRSASRCAASAWAWI